MPKYPEIFSNTAVLWSQSTTLGFAKMYCRQSNKFCTGQSRISCSTALSQTRM